MTKLMIAIALLAFGCVVVSPPSNVAPEPNAEFTLKDLPPWSRDAYKADLLIAAAMKLQSLGQDKARGALLDLVDFEKSTKAHEVRLKATGLTGERLERAVDKAAIQEMRQREGIILLCRMLFAAKPGGKFRRPGLGFPHFICYGNAQRGLLEPIEIVDGVPFLMVMGYTVGGLPEFPDAYLKYCIEGCDWNPMKYGLKTAVEKQQSLDKLIGYLRSQGNVREDDRKFLSSQIN